jgi:nitroreductase
MMKKLLKKILPENAFNYLKKVKFVILLFVNYKYDAVRFLNYSYVANNKLSQKQLLSEIIFTYHAIEKGLSLKDIRLGFGADKINKLIDLLMRYIDLGYSTNQMQIQAALYVISEYVEYHNRNNYNLSNAKLESFNFRYYLNNSEFKLGGVINLSKAEVLKQLESNFHDFAKSRYSIRNFSGEEVDIGLINKAIDIAQKSPSVCNRQSSRVYIIKDIKAKEALGKIQNGNRGFGHIVDKYIIVTSSLNSFRIVGERNQSYIDGGMYAMSLLYGLHYVGLAACALNWSVEQSVDKEIRRYIPIPNLENIILIIAVGNYPEKFSVARSCRNNASDVTHII